MNVGDRPTHLIHVDFGEHDGDKLFGFGVVAQCAVNCFRYELHNEVEINIVGLRKQRGRYKT